MQLPARQAPQQPAANRSGTPASAAGVGADAGGANRALRHGRQTMDTEHTRADPAPNLLSVPVRTATPVV